MKYYRFTLLMIINLLLLLAAGLSIMLFYEYKKDWESSISYFSNIATILSVPTLIIAIISYFKSNKNESKVKKDHFEMFLEKLLNQLKLIGSYAKGIEKDGNYIGYPESERKNWIELEWKSRCNPFQSVVTINQAPLNLLPNLPIEFTKGNYKTEIQLIELIDRLNAQVNILNFFINDILHFKYSRSATENIRLSEDLETANGIYDLNINDKSFAECLLNMNIFLHFQIIGEARTEPWGLYRLHMEIQNKLAILMKKYPN